MEKSKNSINVEGGFLFCGRWNFSKSVSVGPTFIREMRVQILETICNSSVGRVLAKFPQVLPKWETKFDTISIPCGEHPCNILMIFSKILLLENIRHQIFTFNLTI